VAALSLSLGLGLEACEPCEGILGCTSNPRISFGGQLIVRETGAAVRGVPLDFVRTGGVTLVSDSVTATTDAYGHFQLAVDAAEMGEVVGDLVVRAAAPWSPYRVRNLRFRTSEVRGEGQVLGRLVVDPYIEFIGVLFDRRDGRLLAGAHLTILRTGGVAVSAPDSVEMTVDSDGRFLYDTRAAELGGMIADLVITAPSLPRAYRLRGVQFEATYLDRLPQVGGVWSVGTGLPYFGVLFRRGTGYRSAGIEVEFRRTGGIAADPDTFVVSTNADGAFSLVTTPLADGVLVGDLIVRPPPPAVPDTIHAIRLQTVETESSILFGVWGYGTCLPYFGVLFRHGSLIRSAGIEVEFQRTGGIAADPDTFVVSTNADGAFSLVTTPLADGVLVGNLIVRPPPPAVPDTIQAIRLQTVDTEQPILFGVWGFGYTIFYGSALWLRGTEGPAIGLEVEFQRTGGIGIVPEHIVTRTDSAGRFSLGAGADGAGEVVGDLTVRLPAPLPPTVIPGVRIATFASSEMRFLGYWGVGPSLRYVGQLLRADARVPIADAVVEFRRTSGIAVSPSVLMSRSIESGLFALTMNPLDTGEVVGNLTIRPPAPFRDTTFTGVRLQTFDSDAQRLGGTWLIAPPQ